MQNVPTGKKGFLFLRWVGGGGKSFTTIDTGRNMSDIDNDGKCEVYKQASE